MKAIGSHLNLAQNLHTVISPSLYSRLTSFKAIHGGLVEL